MSRYSGRCLSDGGAGLDLFGQGPWRRRILAWTALCVALVYLAGVTDCWWPTSDSALYLGLGRSLAEGQGYVFNGQPHSLVTPGLPLLLAGLRLAAGEGYWAAHLLMALCALGSLALAYAVVRRWTDPATALVASAATGLSYTFFFTSHRILTDVPFTLVFWAVLYCAVRSQRGSARWLILVSLLTMAGLLIRLPGLLLVGALAAGLLLDNSAGTPWRRRLLGALSVAATVALLASLACVQARQLLASSQSYAGLHSAWLVTELRQQGPLFFLKVWFGAAKLLPFVLAETLTSQDALWPLGIILVGLAVVGTVRLWLSRQRMPGTIWVLYLLGLATLTRAHYDARYLMPVQPILVMVAAVGLRWSVERFCAWRRFPRLAATGTTAVLALAAFLLVCNAPRLLRNAVYYTYLSHTPRYYDVVREGKFKRLFAIADVLKAEARGPDLAAVDIEDVRIVHWLTRWRIRPLPETARQTVADAREVYEFARTSSGVRLVVLDTAGSAPRYRQALFWFVATAPLEFEFLREARGDFVFRRLAEP